MNIEMLVNRDNSLSKDYVPEELIDVIPEYEFASCERISKVAFEAYLEFKNYVKQNNINIYLYSGYRSYERQQILYDRFVEKIGIESAKKRVALSGTSEHQTGLAFDISLERDGVDIDMNEEEAQYLENVAHNFGFILRYPKGKEEITGYQYEPWHFRYVGIELASYLKENDLTLEEYYQKTIKIK